MRFLTPDGAHDAFADGAIEEMQRQGKVWFGGTTWCGMRAMRISVCNWQTSTDDVACIVEEVVNALESVKAKYAQTTIQTR